MDPSPATEDEDVVSVRSDESATERRVDLWRILTAIGIVGCLPTIAAVGARFGWLLELFVHFRAYYAGAFLLATAVFLLGRKWKRAALWGTFCVWNAAGIVPLYIAPNRPNVERAATSIKLLTANVHTENREYQRFIDLIRKERPDVVVAMEVDTRWAKALKALEGEYPYRTIRPRSDNFGIAFFSRVPTMSLEEKTFGTAEVPSIVAKLAAAQGNLTLIATHPLPPISPEYSALRNEQLASVADFARGLRSPVVLAGDLNTTSWSPFFQDVLNRTGLHDSRRGFGIQPTWTGNRFLLRLPIDHILVSADIEVIERRVGDDVGSDHFPVVAELRIW